MSAYPEVWLPASGALARRGRCAGSQPHTIRPPTGWPNRYGEGARSWSPRTPGRPLEASLARSTRRALLRPVRAMTWRPTPGSFSRRYRLAAAAVAVVTDGRLPVAVCRACRGVADLWIFFHRQGVSRCKSGCLYERSHLFFGCFIYLGQRTSDG